MAILTADGVATAERAGLGPLDLATLVAAVLMIDDMRVAGLIDGGPQVVRYRCKQTLSRLADQGIVPTAEATLTKAVEILAELGVVRA